MGDFNGDGKLDLVVTNTGGNTVSILFGRGDGTFNAQVTHTVGRGPTSVAVADFNGDRTLDLAVVNDVDNTVSILLGKGDGTFQAPVSYATGETPFAVATGDFNGDGKLISQSRIRSITP